jgi:hypothetical protein
VLDEQIPEISDAVDAQDWKLWVDPIGKSRMDLLKNI